MTRNLFIALIFLTPAIAFAATPPLTTNQGGTGVSNISTGSVPFGSVFNLRIGTSSALQFSNLASRLTFTYGSSTALSATTICLTGDTCRTSWPTSGTGGSGNVSTSSAETAGQLAYWTSTGATPALLGQVATTAVSCTGNISCTAFTALGAASSIAFTGDLPFANLTQGAANTVLANATGGTADFAALATSSLFSGTNGQVLARVGGTWVGVATTTAGTGLTYTGSAFTVDLGTSIDLTSEVTGDLPFANLAQVSANSVLANVTSATADAASLSTTSLFAGVNGQVLAFSGGKWISVATTTAGTGLTYTGSAFTVDLGTSIDLTAEVTGDLPFANLAQVSANSVLANVTSATADAVSLSTSSLYTGTNGQVLARSGGTWIGVATTTLANISGTLALTQLATQAANTVVANNTSASAAPTAVATSSFFGVGVGGNVLAWNNGATQWVATTSLTNTAPITTTWSAATNQWTVACATCSTAVYLDPFTHANSLSSATTSGIGIGTTTPWAQLSVSTTTATGFNVALFAVASSSNATLFNIMGNGNVGIGTSTPMSQLAVTGTSTFWGTSHHFGASSCKGGVYASGLQSIEYCGDDNNTFRGVQYWIENKNAGVNAWTGIDMGNNLSDATVTHFGGMFLNSSTYTDTSFGTAVAVKNAMFVQNSDGALLNIVSTSTEALNPAYWAVYTGGVTAGAADVSGNERMRIDLAGNVAFGTTTPTKHSTLTVASSTPYIDITDSNGALNGKHLIMGFDGGLFTIGTTSDTAYNSTSTALSIDPQGQAIISIGSSTPAAKLAVHANNGDTSLNLFMIGSSTASATSTHFQVTNTGAVYAPNTTPSGSAQTGYWCYDTSGQLIRDTVVCLVSARKFKTDIKPLDIGLEELLKVQPVSYYYKDTTFGVREQIGVIADDVAKIDDRLVGYDNNGDVHSFNYMQYTAWMTKAIQDFYGQFQSLVARVSGLEARLDAQQKEIDELKARLP